MKATFSITLLLAILLLASCKKETAQPTLKDKLTAKVWKSTSLRSNGVDNVKWCWMNSLYSFTKDGFLYYTQGDNLGACGMDPIGTIDTIPYQISADEKYVILISNYIGSGDSFEVVSISDELLKTRRVVNKNTPGESVWEDTFTAQ
jgi:hypothetical protein